MNSYRRLGLALLTMAWSAYGAPSETPPAAPSPCPQETQRFCTEAKDFAAVGECLKQHREELSPSCKQELERLVQARSQASARGGGAFSAFGGLNAMGPPLPLVSYEGRFIPGDDDSRQLENKFNLSVPVYRGGSDSLALSVAAANIHFADAPQLDSGAKLSQDFSRLELGAQYSHQLEGKRNFGLRGSIGYAGDEIANARDDLAYSLAVTYGYPSESGKGYWLLMAFMSNNSPLVNFFPIPGVAYVYRGDKVTGLFAFPIFSLQWTPVDPWSFAASIFGVTLQSEVAYGHLDRFQTFLAYGYTMQSFLPHDRLKSGDRLSIHDQRVSVGGRLPVGDSAQIEAQAGRSFDRALYVGQGLLNKDRGETEFDSAWFVSASVKVLL